jgi:hypothetical protein
MEKVAAYLISLSLIGCGAWIADTAVGSQSFAVPFWHRYHSHSYRTSEHLLRALIKASRWKSAGLTANGR